ncbi:hypothetical protein [Burkholderia territorii]|nr:hypothetical protein [Burkholderia territorii]
MPPFSAKTPFRRLLDAAIAGHVYRLTADRKRQYDACRDDHIGGACARH